MFSCPEHTRKLIDSVVWPLFWQSLLFTFVTRHVQNEANRALQSKNVTSISISIMKNVTSAKRHAVILSSDGHCKILGSEGFTRWLIMGTSTWEQDKIAKFFCSHCLGMHKVQFAFNQLVGFECPYHLSCIHFRVKWQFVGPFHHLPKARAKTSHRLNDSQRASVSAMTIGMGAIAIFRRHCKRHSVWIK